MSDRLIIESTADGSHTLFVPEMQEHYHSVNGAKQESLHVFIKQGLEHTSKSLLNILEVGFGTGLNALLTFQSSEVLNKKINYTTLELYPLSLDLIEKLNYTDNEKVKDQLIFERMHSVSWDERHALTDSFSLYKIQTNFQKLEWEISAPYDLIYFDAFAPDKQAEMWTQSLFDFLYVHTATEGILTTYCAKGAVRRMMQQAGYTVERLPGPPGKREMLRATKS